MNKKKKKFSRAAARTALHFFTAFFRHLPYACVNILGQGVIAAGSLFTGRHKRIAWESLTIAFGKEKSPRELKRIIDECFWNVGRSLIELIYFIEHPEFIKKKVTLEGKKHLDSALAEGLGVIGVTAHFGNFPLMLLKFAAEGYPTHAIMRPARDEEIEDYFLKTRTRLGLQTVYSQPRTECVNRSLKILRGNELLFIPLDQNFGAKGGVFVDFFGQQAATATGPVVFALRTGAPILPVFTVRSGFDTHRVIIEPPFHLAPGQDDQETIQINTAKITKIIEQYIRRYPREWGWMHRRWKSRPKAEE